MSILNINGLTHIYDSKTLFQDAELSINNGEHCGIVGLNGAGKSTFMNIIAGRVIQDEGEVKWLNGIRWGYLDQHANIDRTKTVMEYLNTSFSHLFELNERLEQLYEKMSEVTDMDELDTLIKRSATMQEDLEKQGFYDLESRVKKVANGLGVGAFGYDTLISTLSGGQRAKLMLSKLLLSDLDVMLLDEPTNFLDIEHIEWLKKFLDTYKGTFLLISHDTEFLNSVCKVIINIENKDIKKYSGNYDDFMAQYESNSKQYAEAFEKQQREIKNMKDYIARNSARAATAGMANSRKKMLDKIEVLDKPVTSIPAHFDFPYVLVCTKHLLEVENLVIGYDNKPILPPINLHMDSETKMWIRGTNGLGKSTLIKTLMRRLNKIDGKFTFNINTKPNYIEQDLEFRNSTISATQYMNETFPRMSSRDIRTELAKVGLKNDLATKAICNLSGGEQVKIKLCVMTQIESNLLVMDEPTNHLDVTAKESLQEALIKYPGAILLVSHEPGFASAVCNDVFDIEF